MPESEAFRHSAGSSHYLHVVYYRYTSVLRFKLELKQRVF